MRWTAVLAVAIGLVAAGAAPARPAARGRLSLRLDASLLVFGSATTARGQLFAGGHPLAGATIHLEANPLPSRSGWTAAPERRTTGPDGRFSFTTHPSRSYRVRAAAEDPRVTSPARNLYVVPRLHLRRYRSLGKGRYQETLLAAGPRDVRLKGRVYLYLSRYAATRVPFWRFGWLRPVRAGVSKMVVRFRTPRRWRGSFHFAVCYDAPRATGLDDPRTRCSKRPRRL